MGLKPATNPDVEAASIELSIDGKTVTASETMTLLDAARSAGISIPTVCHHEKLEPFGGCRLCVVEADAVFQPLADLGQCVAVLALPGVPGKEGDLLGRVAEAQRVGITIVMSVTGDGAQVPVDAKQQFDPAMNDLRLRPGSAAVDALSSGPFVIDHDQTLGLSANAVYNVTRSLWASINLRYDSGLVSNPSDPNDVRKDPDYADLLPYVNLASNPPRVNPRTVLFITHAVEEAVYLGDRVFLMAAKPGRLIEILKVPRPVESPEESRRKPWFINFCQALLRRLEEEAPAPQGVKV